MVGKVTSSKKSAAIGKSAASLAQNSKYSSAQSSDDVDKKKIDDLTERQRVLVREVMESVYMTKKWRFIGINFLRGIAFGLGTFLGGTIIVAILIYVLTHTGDVFPGIRDYLNNIINSLQRR